MRHSRMGRSRWSLQRGNRAARSFTLARSPSTARSEPAGTAEPLTAAMKQARAEFGPRLLPITHSPNHPITHSPNHPITQSLIQKLLLMPFQRVLLGPLVGVQGVTLLMLVL